MPPGIGYPPGQQGQGFTGGGQSGAWQFSSQFQPPQPQMSSLDQMFSGLGTPRAGMQIPRQPGMNFPQVQDWLASQGAGDQFGLGLNPETNIFTLLERGQGTSQQEPAAPADPLAGLGLFEMLGLIPQAPSLHDILGGMGLGDLLPPIQPAQQPGQGGFRPQQQPTQQPQNLLAELLLGGL